MRIRIGSGTAASLLLLLAASCGHGAGRAPAAPVEAEAPGTTVAPFFPLAEGNAWRYRGTFLGNPVDRTVSLVGRDGPWFVDSEGERYRIDQEGLRSPERYLLKAPVEQGASWRSVVSITSTERYEISETGASVSVPAGRFDGCVRVTAHNRYDRQQTLWKTDTFCPGVGLVRLETWMETANQGRVPQVRLELTEYRVAPDGARR